MYPSEITTYIGYRVDFLCASESFPTWSFEGHNLPKYAFTIQIGITNQYRLVIFPKYLYYSGVYGCNGTKQNKPVYGSSLLLLEGEIKENYILFMEYMK